MENNNENVKNEVNENSNNNQNKPAKNGKQKAIILAVVVLVLILVIGLFAGLLIGGGNVNKIVNTIKEKSESVEKKEEEAQASKKIDASKPWVYDADYHEGKTVKTVSAQYTEESSDSTESLKYPFININSEYAESINKELQNLFEVNYSSFGGANRETGVSYGYVAFISYDYCVTDNILSVILTERIGATNADIGTSYRIYNINLNTLEEATLEDVYKECGFQSEEELLNKVDIAIANAVNKGEIFDDATWNKEDYYINQNKKFGIIVPGPALADVQLEVSKEIIEEDVVSNSSAEASNTSINQSESNGNVLGLNGQFYDIKSIALVEKEIGSQNSEGFELNYDVDNDGSADRIKLEIKTQVEGDLTSKYGNILVEDGASDQFKANEQIMNADNLAKFYVVDFDKSDKYLDLVTVSWLGSAWNQYSIYKFNGTEYKKIVDFEAFEGNLYTDQNGKIVTDRLNNIKSTPIIASSYYDYKSAKYVDIDLSKFSNRLITFTDVAFSESLEDENKVFEASSQQLDITNEVLESLGIKTHKSVNAYLLEIVDNSIGESHYKVKLENGTVGYFLGPWAG